MRVRSRILALLGSVAAMPLLAGAINSAAAQQAPGGGSFPGSFLVPGTNTSFKVGGYAKFDYQYDFATHQDFVANGAGTAPVIAILPVTGARIHGDSRLSAAESRFNIETRTPTGYGELKTFIEGDFEGVSGVINQTNSGVSNSNTFQINSNRSAFALRHAYGTLGPLLAGQYFSLFEDLAAAPETLDFGGAIGVSGPLRQAQARYVFSAGNGLTLGVSAENPQTVVVSAAPSAFGNATNTQPTLGSSTFGLGQGDKMPDFVGAVIWSQGPGHIAFRGVVRDLYDHNPAGGTAATGVGPAGVSNSTFGWGAGVSGDYHVFGKDDIIFQVNGGKGIGRYITNTGDTQADSVISVDGSRLSAVPAYGGVLGYQHWWTDRLRSNIEGSVIYQKWERSLFAGGVTGLIDGATGSFGSLTRREISSHVNLIWSPVPAVDLGIEFIWEQRLIEANLSGQLVRTQTSAKFKF